MRRNVVGPRIALALVLALALGLRLYGLDWDGGQWIHPDERMILMVVSNRLSLPAPEQVPLLLTPQSPLNPAFHAYGSFPMYLLKAVQLLAGEALPLHILARLLSVAFDCGTVLLAYALAASLAGAWWGVLAALLAAVSPIHVQLAHYYTVDTILAFWTALGAYFALRLAATGRLRWALAVGVAAGLAMATKLIGAAILLFAALALAVRLLEGGRWSWRGALRAAGWGAAAGGVALAAFVLADPYAVVDAWAFWGEAGNQALMARGDPRFPYTLQFYYTLPYLYPFWQNLTRGWGIGAGFLAWGGLVWGTVRAGLRIRRPDGWAVLAVWALAFFLVVGGWHAKFPRYLLPMMPLLCVLAAGMLASAGHRWRARGLRVALAAATAVLVAATGVYAVGLLGIFGQEHSWVRASRWMYANVPCLA
ncbi:MAG: ArnT family glycosyltransferase, partial [Anaerolineae bacterium]